MIIHCMLGMSRKTRWVGPMKCTKHWILIRLEQINHKSTLISDFERGSWYVRNPKSEVILWEISNVLLKIEKVSKIYYSWSDLLLRQPAATSLLLATDNWLPLKTYVSANQCGDMLGGCNISLGIRWGNVFDMKIISYKT